MGKRGRLIDWNAECAMGGHQFPLFLLFGEMETSGLNILAHEITS